MSALNGSPVPRSDIHEAAELLYGELVRLPWFVAVEIDEPRRKLIVETKDVRAAQAWSNGRDFFGWLIEVRKGRAVAR